MKPKQSKTNVIIIVLSIIFGLVALTPLIDIFESLLDNGRAGKTVYANAGNSTSEVFLPVILKAHDASDVELTDFWTSDTDDNLQELFYLGDEIKYVTNGVNNLAQTTTVDLSWSQSGPCGITEIFSDSLSLSPGNWQHSFNQVTPECSGSYLDTVQLDYLGYTSTLTTTFEVHLSSQVVTSTLQGFDTCYLPTLNTMQTWWDSSPYKVWNIYLGGINFFCKENDLDQFWIQSVAQQGWDFILTWVGPQSQCSPYGEIKFSNDQLTAYAEGINEAAEALSTANSLGISGDKIIYYDMEGYWGADVVCRQAATSFLQGWTDWMHLRGFKAGAYGSPCSYLEDWYDNDPRLDDVWIAHWITTGYDPNVTVWDVACEFPDSYWSGYQRLRQYFNGKESWGGITMSIDGDVLHGEITTITGTLTTTSSIIGNESPRIGDMDLISPQVGWVLQGDQILMTMDGGDDWINITPGEDIGAVQDVAFLDASNGWLAVLPASYPSEGGIHIYQTLNGGQTWNLHLLAFSPDSPIVGKVYLDFVDHNTGFALLKSQSGSSFSHGRLFATQDGGLTWDERSAPMGEPVVFVDALHGWMTGGPSEDQVYHTEDGGLTWQPQRLPDLTETGVFIGQPVFESPSQGYLPVTILAEPYSKQVLFATGDGGEIWIQIESFALPLGYEPGGALPFSLFQSDWWTGTPGSQTLYTSSDEERSPVLLPPNGLPPGLTELDFASDGVGWALVQDGTCFGDKIPANRNGAGSDPFYCLSQTRLFMTRDGGVHWHEVLIN